MSPGNWLRREIAIRHLSIKDFAAKAELNETAVHHILHDRRQALRDLTIAKIASALDLPFDDVKAAMTNSVAA